MKKCILIIGLLGICSFAQAQFTKSSKSLGLGIGLGWYDNYGYGNTKNWPSFTLYYEQGIHDIEDVGTISLGGLLGFQHSSYNNNAIYHYNVKWNNIYFAARSAMHFNQLEIDKKVDLYAGLSLGFYYWTSSWSGDYIHENNGNSNDLDLLLNVFAGCSYYIQPNFAIFGELGYGISYLTLGAKFHF